MTESRNCWNRLEYADGGMALIVSPYLHDLKKYSAFFLALPIPSPQIRVFGQKVDDAHVILLVRLLCLYPRKEILLFAQISIQSDRQQRRI